MKKVIFFLVFVLLHFSSGAQLIFQKTFSAPGNQNAIAAMQSASDDYYILSETDSGQNNSKDCLLLKLNVSGNLIWSKYFGTTTDDIPTDVKEMSNGKIMLCGYTYLNGVSNVDILLINIDTAGTILWSKTYGGVQNDYGFKMAVSPDSSVVVAGQTFSYGVASSSGYALKINSIGNIVWSVTVSGLGIATNSFNSIDNTFDGGYIFTGYWYQSNNTQIWVVKVDAFGNVISSVANPGPPRFIGYDIKSIPGGDFIVVGKVIDNTSDPASILVLRINPITFSVSFLKKYSTNAYEAASSVIVTPDGNFALAGTGFFNSGFNLIEEGFLIKLNLTGNFVYQKDYHPLGYFSSLNSIINTHDNNLLLTGKIISAIDSSTEVYIIKAQLSTGTSGCFENPISYTSTLLPPNLATGSNDNFGGLSNLISVSSAPVSCVQNDFCSMVGFHELNADLSTSAIYPNPSDGNFIIYFNNDISEKIIQIFDVTGNIIYQKDKIKNTEQEINLTSQPKGIYFLKVFDKDKTSVNKIVLQ